MSSNVDDYIFNLTDPQRIIAVQLRKLLHELVPEIQEKFSFKLPFYHFFGMFCYLNAIPGAVALCFCRGKDLTGEFAALDVKGRAIVASVSLYSVKDIEIYEVREMIVAAALWNKEAKMNKIPMVKKKRRS